jgi:hypothetical protein
VEGEDLPLALFRVLEASREALQQKAALARAATEIRLWEDETSFQMGEWL